MSTGRVRGSSLSASSNRSGATAGHGAAGDIRTAGITGGSRSSESTPPLLIGGVNGDKDLTQEDSVQGPLGKYVPDQLRGIWSAKMAWDVNWDWATLTAGSASVSDLWAGDPEESGKGRWGFRSSEKRGIMGGFVWRRWDPYQSSKAFGLEYESIESCEGFDAQWLVRVMRGRHAVPTRLDVAWDFRVAADAAPVQLAELVRPRLLQRGIGTRVAGSLDDHTAQTIYVGSRDSARMLRVYRKDVQSPLIAGAYGPIMRVEVELRDDLARAVWVAAERSNDDAFAAAAGIVEDFVGIRLQDRCAGVKRETLPDAGVIDAVGQMLFQYGDLLDDLEERHLLRLVRDVHRANRKPSRMADAKREKRRELLGTMIPEQFRRLLECVIAGRSGREAASLPSVLNPVSMPLVVRGNVFSAGRVPS